MTTVETLIEDVRNQFLVGTWRHITGRLASAVDTSIQSLTLESPVSHVHRGSLIAIGHELCYVSEAASDSTDLTVLRGWAGTETAAHAQYDEVEVNPRYPRVTIFNAILDEIRSWSDSLFTTTNVEVSLGAGATAIEVDDYEPDPLYVLRVLRQRTTPYTDRWVRQTFRAEHDARGPGTLDIYIDRVLAQATSFRLVIAIPFDLEDFALDTDLEDDVGLVSSQLDVLKYGVVQRMFVGKGVIRLYTEAAGQSRDAEEVQPAEIRSLAEYFRALRTTRLNEESKRLLRKWGLRAR